MLREPLPPLHDRERPDAWAVAYLDGSLSAAERAEYEAHLAGHADCRAQVETLRAAFAATSRVLAEGPPRRTGKDYLAVARAAEARLAGGRAAGGSAVDVSEEARKPGRSAHGSQLEAARGRARAPRFAPWLWASGLTAALGAAAAVLLLWAPRPGPREPALLEPEALTHTFPGAGAGSEAAPAVPGQPPPFVPDTAALSVRVARQGQVAEVSVAREATDRYLAIAIFDAQGAIWIAHSGYRPVPAGQTTFRIDLARLPGSALEVAVLAAAQPLDRRYLADPLRFLADAGHFPHLAALGVRAAAVAAVPP
ncbi:MAG: anti-sigma factor family protein [Myxococcales bacterium]